MGELDVGHIKPYTHEEVEICNTMQAALLPYLAVNLIGHVDDPVVRINLENQLSVWLNPDDGEHHLGQSFSKWFEIYRDEFGDGSYTGTFGTDLARLYVQDPSKLLEAMIFNGLISDANGLAYSNLGECLKGLQEEFTMHQAAIDEEKIPPRSGVRESARPSEAGAEDEIDLVSKSVGEEVANVLSA